MKSKSNKTINSIKCYSGGVAIKSIDLDNSLVFEPDENGFTICNKKEEVVFVWNGTYSIENSSMRIK